MYSRYGFDCDVIDATASFYSIVRQIEAPSFLVVEGIPPGPGN